jgi:phage-related protein
VANQKIVIDARIDRKAAQADLKALKADVTNTAKQIASLDRQITTASNKHLKLADDLKTAQEAAASTQEAIEEIGRKIDLSKQYEALRGQNEELTATLSNQDQTVERLTADYKAFLAARDKMGDNFTPEQAAASEAVNANYKSRIAAAQTAADATAAQLEQVNQQMDALHNQGVGMTDPEDVKRLEALNAQLDKQKAKAAAVDEAYKKQSATVAGLQNQQAALTATLQSQQAAVSRQQKLAGSLPTASSSKSGDGAITTTTQRIKAASKAATYFGSRLRQLVAGALIFNLISKALTALVNEMGTAILKTNGVQKAFAQLKGSAATAAAGLASALAPVITWLINLINSLLNAFIRLISLITGKSIGVMKKQGKAISATGSAAKKASGELAKFDELDVLNKNDSGGGGSGISPDFSGIDESVNALSDRMKELLDKFKEGFKKGFGDAGEGLKNIKDDLAKIGAILKEIWTDPEVSAAVKRFTDTCAYALGEVVGAAASIGVSIAENLVGGLARYLERNKEFLKGILANAFNLGADIVGLFGDFAAAVAVVFRSLGSEGAKQLTSGFIGIFANSALGRVQTREQIGYALAKPLMQPFIDNAEKIREVFSNFFAAIAPFFVGISDGIANFYAALGNLYNEVIKPLIDGLAEFNSSILGSLLDKLNAFLESLTGLADPLHIAGEAIGFLVGAFGGLQVAAGFVSAAVGFLASPFGIAVAAIGAAIAAGVLLYQNWDMAKDKVQGLIDTIQPAFAAIKTAALNLATAVEETWTTYVVPVLDSAKTAIQSLWEIVIQFWEGIVYPIIQEIMAVILELWNDSLKPLWDKITDLVQSVIALVQVLCQWVVAIIAAIVQAVLELWNQVLAPLISWLLATFGPVFKDVFNAIGTVVKTIIKVICDKIDMALTALKGIIDFLTGVFKGDWEGAWNAIKQIFFGVFDSLHKKAADVLNGIKERVGNVVQGVKDLVSGLGDLGGAIANKVSSAWNAVTSGSPAQQSMEAPLASLPVPALARGAVIPPNHRFLAMLGDQTNGTNVEAPLETIQEALAEVLAAQGGQDITIRFAGDLAQLVRLLNPYIDKENNRRGARLVSGGVY